MDIEDREFQEEMLLREAKIRYPEVEEWVLNMAIKAHLNLNGEKFVSDDAKGEEIKKSYSQDTVYTTI
jgi:hypothetical protein